MILAIGHWQQQYRPGCIEGKTIAKEARIATDLIKTSDQYMAELKNMLDLFEIPIASIEGSIISSVVPPLLNSFKTRVVKLTGKMPLVVGPGIKDGAQHPPGQPGFGRRRPHCGRSGCPGGVQAAHAHHRHGHRHHHHGHRREGNYLGGCICPA